jgi:DNA-binding GntR family transcriptional regulator
MELRERIAVLTYPPGTALSETKLADEFGVSRTPIRQVLQRLEFDGLVEAKHGIGTIVSAIDFMYLQQVYALRLKLITLISELSPMHASEGDLVILESLYERAKEMAGPGHTPVQLSRLYTHFNDEVLRVIGNRPLREITDRLFYQTHRVWLQLLPVMDWEEEVRFVVEEFGEVLAGLRSRDLAHVAKVRRAHFVACLQRINRHLSGLELVDLKGESN